MSFVSKMKSLKPIKYSIYFTNEHFRPPWSNIKASKIHLTHRTHPCFGRMITLAHQTGELHRCSVMIEPSIVYSYTLHPNLNCRICCIGCKYKICKWKTNFWIHLFHVIRWNIFKIIVWQVFHGFLYILYFL